MGVIRSEVPWPMPARLSMLRSYCILNVLHVLDLFEGLERGHELIHLDVRALGQVVEDGLAHILRQKKTVHATATLFHVPLIRT